MRLQVGIDSRNHHGSRLGSVAFQGIFQPGFELVKRIGGHRSFGELTELVGFADIV